MAVDASYVAWLRIQFTIKSIYQLSYRSCEDASRDWMRACRSTQEAIRKSKDPHEPLHFLLQTMFSRTSFPVNSAIERWAPGQNKSRSGPQKLCLQRVFSLHHCLPRSRTFINSQRNRGRGLEVVYQSRCKQANTVKVGRTTYTVIHVLLNRTRKWQMTMHRHVRIHGNKAAYPILCRFHLCPDGHTQYPLHLLHPLSHRTFSCLLMGRIHHESLSITRHNEVVRKGACEWKRENEIHELLEARRKSEPSHIWAISPFLAYAIHE